MCLHETTIPYMCTVVLDPSGHTVKGWTRLSGLLEVGYCLRTYDKNSPLTFRADTSHDDDGSRPV